MLTPAEIIRLGIEQGHDPDVIVASLEAAGWIFQQRKTGGNDMTSDDAVAMIRTSFSALVQSGLIPKEGGQDKLTLGDDVIIFGSESPLDSISFVTLISDVEERLNIHTGNALATDIMTTLSESDGFSIDNPHLTVKSLAEFIVRLSQQSAPA